jgi:integrase
MPHTPKVPSYRRHNQSGQAVVTLRDALGNRRDVLLGKYGTAQSRAEYARVIAEWEANDRRLPTTPRKAADLTVNELLLAYYRHAKSYYVKDGKPTSEPAAIKSALRFVKRLYGHTPAAEFGPLALKAVRQAMIDHPITRKYKARDPETGEVKEEVRVLRQGLARKCINKQLGRIKRMFAWAVEEELVPVEVHAALLRVKGLRKGKSGAREKPRIQAVADALVDRTLPHLPPIVADMVRVQRLTGMRPQDVVQLRPCDLDMSGPVWEYRPARHKTEHHERERIVFLGPRAQAILKPYLPLSTTAYLFSPKQSEALRNGRRRAGRRSPLTPAQAARPAKAGRKRPPRDRYGVDSYRRAIRRACLKTGLPIWVPLQLRHSAGTAVRKRYGLEASQAVLGHAELGVTQVYAEKDLEAARRVMAEIG